MEPRYITLQAWAERRFGIAPHRNTLHRWAKDGSIVPAPFKLGREYMVTPDARHTSEPQQAKRLTGRMTNGLSPA